MGCRALARLEVDRIRARLHRCRRRRNGDGSPHRCVAPHVDRYSYAPRGLISVEWDVTCPGGRPARRDSCSRQSAYPGTGDSASPKLFPVARGWRVRWTTDGSALALGNNPARAIDNEPSQTWSALDPVTGALHGSLPSSAKLADVKFTMGPTLARSEPISLMESPPIPIQRGNKTLTIQTTRGVITIADPPGVGSTGAQRVVGAGVALAATAGGRYIIALAPRSKPDPNESSVEPVVYTVTW